MGPRDGLHPVVPADFCNRWDAETPQEALAKAEQAPTSTTGPRPACPGCGSVKIQPKTAVVEQSNQKPGDYRCTLCNLHFDDPDETKIMKHDPINKFDWIGDDDLADPDERGFTPVLRGVDDETLTEVAIRVYRPWDDGAGPSYRDLAAIVPHGRYWVGDRVRAWKDGEYRELVADPTPSVDASSDATAVATDGGAARSRWEAYGS